MYKFKNFYLLVDYVHLSRLPIDIDIEKRIVVWPLAYNTCLRLSEDSNGNIKFEILNKPKKWYKYLQEAYGRVINFLISYEILELVG